MLALDETLRSYVDPLTLRCYSKSARRIQDYPQTIRVATWIQFCYVFVPLFVLYPCSVAPGLINEA
jgi:hypothetical protein